MWSAAPMDGLRAINDPVSARGQAPTLSRIAVLHFSWSAVVVGLLIMAQWVITSPGETNSYALLFAPLSWAIVGLASLPIHLFAAAITRRLVFDRRFHLLWTPVVITSALWLLIGLAWLGLSGEEQRLVQIRTTLVFLVAAPGFGALMALATPRTLEASVP